MTDGDDIPADDADLIERALALIAFGRPSTSSAGGAKSAAGNDESLQPLIAVQRRDLDADETLRRYFRRVRSADVVAELQLLESPEAISPADIQDATKWLAAYFRWSTIEHATLTSDEHPIAPLASRFAIAISTRLAGPLRDAESGTPSSVLPVWKAPDAALGWTRPRGRPANPGNEDRDIGIALLWAQLEAEEVDSASRELRVGQAFGVGSTVVHDALAKCPELACMYSASKEKHVIDDVIATLRPRRSRTRSVK